MVCPKCGSDKVKVQAIEKKRGSVTVGATIAGFGFGLAASTNFGGAIIGALIGLVVSFILKAVVPKQYTSLISCQECGYSGEVK